MEEKNFQEVHKVTINKEENALIKWWEPTVFNRIRIKAVTTIDKELWKRIGKEMNWL